MAQLNPSKTSPPPSLQAKNLHHKYGPTEILRDINFTLEKGKVISVVGPSGGGKTTLLHLCGGLLDITNGEVFNHFTTQAFAFQDARLLPWLTAIDNIAFGLKAQGIKKAQRRALAEKMAKRLGLEELDFAKFPKDLSGGMRQRVSFARALVIEPQILFLDEPFSALDIGLKKELQQLLIEWITEKQLSVFFITHDLSEAIQLSDEILVLGADPGRIVKRFELNTPHSERRDEFVFETTRDLLQDPQILTTFELNFSTRQSNE